jgi:hypothetical protein
MPKTKKQTKIDESTIKKPTKRKRAKQREKIIGNFRGSEDIFWTNVVNGFKKFLESPWK